MNIKPVFIVAIAVITLGTGIYVMFANNSNTNGASASGENREAACKLSVERGKSVEASAQGDVAAFRSLEDPLDMLGKISFKNIDGKLKTLADWQGRTVLLNLWATWCPPCREEMPWLEELEVTKGSDKFQVVPVSIDQGSQDKPLDFLRSINIEKMPFMQDSTMNAFQNLRKKGVALGMPTTLLVDTNGCAMGVLNGPAHWASDDAKKLIDSALGLDELS